MNSEIIPNVAYDKYGDFQHNDFILSQIFISLFWGLFNDKTDLRLRYILKRRQVGSLFGSHKLIMNNLPLDIC
jgi:hypothetical protein